MMTPELVTIIQTLNSYGYEGGTIDGLVEETDVPLGTVVDCIDTLLDVNLIEALDPEYGLYAWDYAADDDFSREDARAELMAAYLEMVTEMESEALAAGSEANLDAQLSRLSAELGMPELLGDATSAEVSADMGEGGYDAMDDVADFIASSRRGSYQDDFASLGYSWE